MVVCLSLLSLDFLEKRLGSWTVSYCLYWFGTEAPTLPVFFIMNWEIYRRFVQRHMHLLSKTPLPSGVQWPYWGEGAFLVHFLCTYFQFLVTYGIPMCFKLSKKTNVKNKKGIWLEVTIMWGIKWTSSYYLNVEQLHIATFYLLNILNRYHCANFQTKARKQKNTFCNIFIIEMTLLAIISCLKL